MTRSAGFDPRGAWPLAVTCVALVAYFFYNAPGLGALSEYPELRVNQPTKALLQQSLVERAAAQKPTWEPFGRSCQLCTADGVREAWWSLKALLDTYDELPDGLMREAVRGLPRARAISLANWGDKQSQEEEPQPEAALRQLSLAEYGDLAGIRPVSAARVATVRSAMSLIELCAALLGLALLVRVRRLPIEPPSGAHTASQAACVFIWCVGANAALVGQLSGEARLLASDLYPLPEAILALPLAAFALHRGSLRALLQALGWFRFRLGSVLAHALIVLAVVVSFSGLWQAAFATLGYVEPWAQTASDVLLYGSDADKLLRCLSLIVVTPLVEEALFTGLLFGGLATRLSFRVAALTAAVLFTANHAYDFVASCELVVGAVASCWAYSRTGSLWPSIVAHAALNASYCSAVLY